MVQTVVLFVAIGLFAAVAERDVRTRHIPNELALAIAILGLLRVILVDSETSATLTFAATAAVFVTSFLLFWRGILGGGDVKLVAAMALLVGYRDLFRFLIIMSLCGAAVALVTLVRSEPGLKRWRISRHLTLPSEMAVEPRNIPPDQSSVPYGAAIAAAGAMILILQTSFPR